MTADHGQFDELAVGWALHALEPEDESSFAVHLPGCARCAATVAETSEVMAAMATDLPQPEPSEGLLHRIRAAVEQTEQLPEPAAVPVVPAVRPIRAAPEPRRIVEQRSRWRSALPRTLVAAALAAIVGLGIWDVVLTNDRQDLQSTVAEQSAFMDSLFSDGEATVAPMTHRGDMVAMMVARDGEVGVVPAALSANDAQNSTYVLWGLGEGGPTSLGTFDVARPQLKLQTVGSGQTDLSGFSGYGISLEPGRQAPPSPTEIVAQG
jgi:negative regulator of sigma E activity